MNPQDLIELLRGVKEGSVSTEDALARLKGLPFEDLEFAKVDHHRALRRGFPEVIYGGGKTPEQIVAIVERIAARDQNVLVTRTTPAVHTLLSRSRAEARYHEVPRCITVSMRPAPPLVGRVAVVSAGTSDLPVAEEAAVTAEFHGATVDRVHDVGVAGLHRLLAQGPTLRDAHVVIVVAGMEGALPSVVGGLVDAPVIAVPTSVGYGASFHGVAALLAMLNSCASGIGVVNIDNGFGAGYLASVILRKRVSGP
ncbi:MAG: nickel pincer cofactor biosynthesis protein LarB [Vicinamibacteria bacterium]